MSRMMLDPKKLWLKYCIWQYKHMKNELSTGVHGANLGAFVVLGQADAGARVSRAGLVEQRYHSKSWPTGMVHHGASWSTVFHELSHDVR